ncbi:MAG: hypothetical protein AB1894_16080 [Chloroflexota bacterium]
MNETHPPTHNPDEPGLYAIRLQGHLDSRWSSRFGNASITLEAGGQTLLTCPVVDQAELYSLLKKIRDAGLPLLSLMRLESHQTNLDKGERK